MIEIELINGNRILLSSEWGKVYKLIEKTRLVIKFAKKFPFVYISTKQYTQFKYRSIYETINSAFDPTYRVNCTIVQLAALFGEHVTTFEEGMIDSTLSNGCSKRDLDD